MSREPAHVEFVDVWKKFRFGEVNARLSDAIPAMWRRAFGRRDPGEGLWHGEFWALSGLSFTVKPGQSLGLIGHNGAGKSTVLKLLSRILEPTSGSCTVRGRIGALIEVAAGFHPDLTGRENVFLQGTIMGMPRREIAQRFDEIVEFAGVETFIDTPVKRFSSGMQARLGFAIAAHLEPDILLVDEVLSVGDAAFQRRAFARVQELVRRDIPVVVVSHQLEAITTLCTQALLLDRGRVVRAGTPAECIATYLGATTQSPPGDADGAIVIESIALTATAVASGSALGATIACRVAHDRWAEPETVRLCVRSTIDGALLFESGTEQLGLSLPASGRYEVHFDLQMNLQRGIYLIECSAWDRMLGRRRFIGPSAHVEVRDSAPFEGIAQLNAHARLVT